MREGLQEPLAGITACTKTPGRENDPLGKISSSLVSCIKT